MGNKTSSVEHNGKRVSHPGFGAFQRSIIKRQFASLKIEPDSNSITTYAGRLAPHDAELRRAIIENLNLLARYLHQDEQGPSYSSKPTSDLRLDPCDYYPMYKIARFVVRGELRMDVAVLVTLWIKSSEIHVALGETGEVVHPHDFKANTKYVVRKALVAGAQFVGDLAGVDDCMTSYDRNTGVVVSNHDVNFVYTVGHEVEEPRFGKSGIYCRQGIHCFLDPESALAYRNTGFIHCHASSLISAKFANPRDCDDEDLSSKPPRSTEKINPMASQRAKFDDLARRMKDLKALLKADRSMTDRRVEKIVSRTFGDWYYRTNFVAPEEKKVAHPLPAAIKTTEKDADLNITHTKVPATGPTKVVDPDLNKTYSKEEIAPTIVQTKLEVEPSAPPLETPSIGAEEYVPEGSVMLFSAAHELDIPLEPRRVETVEMHRPLPAQSVNISVQPRRDQGHETDQIELEEIEIESVSDRKPVVMM